MGLPRRDEPDPERIAREEALGEDGEPRSGGAGLGDQGSGLLDRRRAV